MRGVFGSSRAVRNARICIGRPLVGNAKTILNQTMSVMDDATLREIHDTLVDLAYKAGQMILDARPTMASTVTKINCPRPSALA
jgi:hypothetical protein